MATSLLDMPVEIFQRICWFLSYVSTCKVRQTCSTLNAQVRQDDLTWLMRKCLFSSWDRIEQRHAPYDDYDYFGSDFDHDSAYEATEEDSTDVDRTEILDGQRGQDKPQDSDRLTFNQVAYLLRPDVGRQLFRSGVRERLAGRELGDDEQEEYHLDGRGPEFYVDSLFDWILALEVPPAMVRNLRVTIMPFRSWRKDQGLLARNYYGLPSFRAPESHPWLMDGELSDAEERIRKGNEDLVLALMIPMLERLRLLHLTSGAPTTSRVLARVAQAYTAPPEARSENLPLSQLRVLTYENLRADSGITLTEVARIVSIPSLEKLVLQFFMVTDFVWPEGCAHSKIKDVYLESCGMTRAAMTALATGFDGPCTFRYSAYLDEEVFRKAPKQEPWDHHVVAIDAKGRRSDYFELRYKSLPPIGATRTGLRSGTVSPKMWDLHNYHPRLFGDSDDEDEMIR